MIGRKRDTRACEGRSPLVTSLRLGDVVREKEKKDDAEGGGHRFLVPFS